MTSHGTRTIFDGKTVIARIIPADSWPPGLAFHSPDDEFIQVGTWRYDAGKELLAHRHNTVARHADRTQEAVFVVSGRMRVRVYGLNNQLLETFEAKAGDCLVMLNGGHGYDILEDDTRVIETKNGPYAGPEKDRVRFSQ